MIKYSNKNDRKLVTVEDKEKKINVLYILLKENYSKNVFININQLDALNLFYNKFISSLYMFRAHVLIVRRAKLYYTVSGIITPIGVMISENV